MLSSTSQRTVNEVVIQLDSEVWNNLAEKAISKMPKFKLTKQTEKIFDDFSKLTSEGFVRSSGILKQQTQQIVTFKQNLIVGTSRIEQPYQRKLISEMPQAITQQAKNKKRLVSAIQLNQKEDQKGNLFRLTINDFPNREQQKVDDSLRTAKYDNIRYNQSLAQIEKERRAMSEHRSLVEKKRFKEMKTFTYDYEGKLISLGHEKNPNAKINVVNMRPNFGNNIKTGTTSSYRPLRQQNIMQILNKRVIGLKTPAIQPPKQSDKDKQQKASRHVKLSQQTPNMLECLKDSDKVQVGVTITDINNKQKFYGAHRDKNEIKNAKLGEFKGQFRQLQKFREKIIIKKLKFKDPPTSHPTVMRTQYVESAHANKLKTEGTDKESRLFTAATGITRKRGIIDIKNQRLYTQNFIEDLD